MTKFADITHVIYDNDGLLLNTEHIYTIVTRSIVEPYGKTFDWSVKSKMIGRKAQESAQVLVDELELPFSAQHYLDVRNERLQALFPSAEAMPGAEDLTRSLKSQGVLQAVASSSDRPNFDLKTQEHQEWFSIFDAVVLGDHPLVTRGKPAPDIFLLAAEALGAKPEHCLVFEDSVVGVEAALTANMSVIAVPDPNMDKKSYADAHQILNSLEEFQPKLWNLPH